MNTAALKRFATAARQKVMSGVKYKLIELGFDAKSNVPHDIPQQIQGATLFQEEVYPEAMYAQRNNLCSNIQHKGIQAIYEEVSYTWFNRIIAIRILEKNQLIQPVLQFVPGFTRMPQIVFDARHGRFPKMTTEEYNRLQTMLQDDNKVLEQFSILLTAFCHSNPILSNCFGRVEDYSELLIPSDILANDGFIDMLNQTDYITAQDYETTELLGWLYQFYISEKKDEVFASFKSGKKAQTTDDIAAATQIFTPNWIVKYMVQNTIGRIYLDNEPYSKLKSEMPYLVDIEPTSKEHQFHYYELSELTMIDPACGSGHILLEGFDLFVKMYREAGYTISKAIKLILKHNILGLELDTRAKQLSMFALLLKACQYDSSFANAHTLPRVIDMPNVDINTWQELGNNMVQEYKLCINDTINCELNAAFKLLEQADNLGSIMRFNISNETHCFIQDTLNYMEQQSHLTAAKYTDITHAFRLILALTDHYAAIVANPPYMGPRNMNKKLAAYIKHNYVEGKADLFSVFMLLSASMLKDNGKYSMINMQSWMFLSSFETLRKNLLQQLQIDSMLHLGPHTFDELSGEIVQNTAFVISNHLPVYKGEYYRLINGKNCEEKKEMFLTATSYTKYSGISSQYFSDIPGSPIGYWIDEKIRDIFKNNPTLNNYCSPRKGNSTSNNTRFLRLWYEVCIDKVALYYSSIKAVLSAGKRWIPYNKGGGTRKWYGYNENLIDWKDNAAAIRDIPTSVITNEDFYMKPGLTWSTVSSKSFGVRFFEKGYIFDNSGCCLFDTGNNRNYLAGFLNSNVLDKFVEVLAPTLSYQSGIIALLPTRIVPNSTIDSLTWENRNISKQDWDAHETSWDFESNPLVALRNQTVGVGNKLASLVQKFQKDWEDKFYKLHSNEEKINRLFIDIYGLQDELTPDVPFNEITILQQGEISVENNQIIWHNDTLIKQLISYIVGLIVGRYRLDKPGLHIAHPQPTSDELETYTYNNRSIKIDDDAIIPILPDDSPFADNLYNQLKEYIRIIFGKDILTENLNYIEQALGKSINDYLQKDFYTDHKKMYQNRPIYWLFSSKKGAFRCLTYMHRMDAYTAEKVRSKYLLPYMESLHQKIEHLRNNNNLSSVQRRELGSLQKAYDECLEYHEQLHTVAGNQIAFDLDDGVVVNYAKFDNVLAKLK